MNLKRTLLLFAMIVVLVAGMLFARGQSAKGTAAPRRIVLTDDQNKPLNELSEQLKQLDQQGQLIRAKASGIVDAYANQAGFAGKPYKLVQIEAGKYAIEEAPAETQAAPPAPSAEPQK